MTDAAATTPPLDPGLWGLLGQPDVMRRLAGAGAGWLCLDSQHGLFDRSAVAATLSALPADGPPVAVRVSQLDEAEIGHALDAGARRVIVPLIDTVEQAERAVAAAAY
ncbi:aldolase/citrate lyase family protein, partial [Mesorhizobium japonicum]|uniref:aldolase/citrate lyase family protein n=1 Tax=Mesorhizobium japonicum TaxID=2066070 RepID=UPI003B5A8F4F